MVKGIKYIDSIPQLKNLIITKTEKVILTQSEGISAENSQLKAIATGVDPEKVVCRPNMKDRKYSAMAKIK